MNVNSRQRRDTRPTSIVCVCGNCTARNAHTWKATLQAAWARKVCCPEHQDVSRSLVTWGSPAVLGHHLPVHRRDIPEISAQPYRTTLLPATVWCHVPFPSQHHITTPRERLIRRVTALLLLQQALMSMLTGRHHYF